MMAQRDVTPELVMAGTVMTPPDLVKHDHAADSKLAFRPRNPG
ncbi:hypothetical protein BV133_526 [Blastochloris viridis]|uniref:Uncharacterized protein n=1 Tax=Blastochloris viridis TaxID=1079 RepID=A0A182CY67_BLAVI|nr:hypothetical protein BV133_526 [Blastochloris viridis]